MTNLENIIMDIKEVNRTHDFWIRNSDGEIKDDVICGDVIPFLEELKAYEIDMSQDAVMTLREGLYDKLKFCNTYNYSACIDHDFEFDYYISPTNDKFIVFIMVHRFGDVRGNYTDMACFEFDDAIEFWELESIMQCKQINERYSADINILNEGYNVYDYIDNVDVGYFCDIEVKDLLESIEKSNT